MPYYLVRDESKGKIVWDGYANDPEQACNFADQNEYGIEESKLFKYEPTNYKEDLKYSVITHNYTFKQVAPGLIRYFHKLDHFKRVRIKKIPWSSSKIWDIVKIILGASVKFIR